MSTQKVAKPDARPQSNGAAINDLWEEAAKAFEVICGHSLQKGSVKSFDDVQKTIEGNGPQGFANGDSSQQADWDKAKSVGLQSLKYLKLLVSVAAQGASFVRPSHFFQDATSSIANAGRYRYQPLQPTWPAMLSASCSMFPNRSRHITMPSIKSSQRYLQHLPKFRSTNPWTNSTMR